MKVFAVKVFAVAGLQGVCGQWFKVRIAKWARASKVARVAQTLFRRKSHTGLPRPQGSPRRKPHANLPRPQGSPRHKPHANLSRLQGSPRHTGCLRSVVQGSNSKMGSRFQGCKGRPDTTQAQIPHGSSQAAGVAQTQTPRKPSKAARVAQAQTPCKSFKAARVAQAQTTCKSSKAFWLQIWTCGFCGHLAIFRIRTSIFYAKPGPEAFEAFWQWYFGCAMAILGPNLELRLSRPFGELQFGCKMAVFAPNLALVLLMKPSGNYNLAVKLQFWFQIWSLLAIGGRVICSLAVGSPRRKPKAVRTGCQIARNQNVLSGWPRDPPTPKAEVRCSFVC